MWYCRICTLWTESTTPSKNFWVANTDLWYIIILQRFHISIILCSFQALLCSSLLRCSKSLVLFGEKRKKAYDGAAAADHVSFSGSCFLLCFRFLCVMLLVQRFKAQSTTDPSEGMLHAFLLQQFVVYQKIKFGY